MALYFDRGSLPDLTEAEQAASGRAYAQVHQKSPAFMALPEQPTDGIERLAEALRAEVGSVILIGIGGSDLGARAIHRALNHQFYNLLPKGRRGLQLFFAGDTTDPVALQEIIDVVDMRDTALIVVSKSGNTIEQMSTFTYLRSKIIEAVGEQQSVSRIVLVTDAASGSLRQLADQFGYRSLSVPGGVGGRFAVLSSVGMVAAAITGVDIKDLLAGAAAVKRLLQEDNSALQYATAQWAAYTRGQHISVMLPYSYGLREFGFWFRQLWAESLGKDGGGPTPIAALGPTDQHSQLQLYQQGPDDKIYTFLTVDTLGHDLLLPKAFPDLEAAAYLEGVAMSDIVASEACATLLALVQAGRPACNIRISTLDAHHLGALFFFFECVTAYAGELFGVDTYDQPGVELSKTMLFGLLGRPGFERPDRESVCGVKVESMSL